MADAGDVSEALYMPGRRGVRQRLQTTAALVVLSLVLVAPTPASAAAVSPWTLDPGSEAAFVTELNARRTAAGLAPLAVDADMTAAARSWAAWMADNDTLQHAGDFVTGAPSNWRKVGENVGRGANVPQLVSAFMASPGHAANVLDPSYNLIGVGVVVTSGGMLYTTHRFAHAPGASGSAPGPPPAPAVLVLDADLPTAPPVDRERPRDHLELLLEAS